MLRSFIIALAMSSLLSPGELQLTRNAVAPGQLTLMNTRWDAVQVEVRVGGSSPCAQNASAATQTLRRNQRWAVVTDEVICWRRESVPGDAASGWTVWDQDHLGPGQVREVTL